MSDRPTQATAPGIPVGDNQNSVSGVDPAGRPARSPARSSARVVTGRPG